MCYVKYDISLLKNISYIFISKSQIIFRTYTRLPNYIYAIFFIQIAINIIFIYTNYCLTFIRLIASKYKNNKSIYNKKADILFK